MLKYVTKFMELARFADDYMTTNMAKVRKFENGLKLSVMPQKYPKIFIIILLYV